MIALTKIDSIDQNELNSKKKTLEKAINKKVFVISSASKNGIDTILRELSSVVRKNRL